MLSQQTEKSIEKFLLDNGIVTKATLENAKLKAAKDNLSLMQSLVKFKALSEEDSVKVVALNSHIPYVDLKNQTVNQDILKLLPKDDAATYMAVPFGITDGQLNVAMIDPSNLQAIDFITRKTGYTIRAYMATKSNIDRLLSLYSQDLGAEVAQALNISDTETKDKKEQVKVDATNVQTLIQDAPITRALNTIIEYAVNSRASDIHIEPREKELKVRYRIDGILQDTMTLPKTIEPALVSRIKILSNLKIDEHRTPQDGQAQLKVSGREIDLRIAIAPIAYGEQVVIRILDKTDALIALGKLGFRGRAFRLIQDGIHKPHGMVLSTGPTGSGKTTTMYAVIKEINNIGVNVITLEDPIEYRIEGINQIQVNNTVGLTFANGLRSILRQDPNIIMVGEIRDRETADLAVQSALTGHLVLSTLHTNSASGVLPRLLDMNIEPFLIASTVNTVIGQRLVRKVCEDCKVKYQASDSAVAMINKALDGVLPRNQKDTQTATEELGYDNLPTFSEKAYTLYKGEGCPACVNGYLGRTGIAEVFAMNSAMEKLLTAHATTNDIQAQAQKDGMLTMQQDGLLKVLTGVTTIEEVARVASDY